MSYGVACAECIGYFLVAANYLTEEAKDRMGLFWLTVPSPPREKGTVEQLGVGLALL